MLEVSPESLQTAEIVNRAKLALLSATNVKKHVQRALRELDSSGEVIRLGENEWFLCKHLGNGENALLEIVLS